MSYKITGRFFPIGNETQGKPYGAHVRDDVYNDYQANKHLAELDGALLDVSTLVEEYIDDEVMPEITKGQLLVEAHRQNGLDVVIKDYMIEKNGETAIWFETATGKINFYHHIIQQAIIDLAPYGMTRELAKTIWKNAAEL